MGTKSTIYEKLKTLGVVTIIACMSVLNINVPRTFAQSGIIVSQAKAVEDAQKNSLTVTSSDNEVVLDAQPDKKMDVTEKKATGAAVKQPDTSPQTTTTRDTSTLVYVGVGLAAAAAIAVGLGASGSSDSSDNAASEPETPQQKPVGASLAGDDWSGRLLLINGQRELVTAVVNQNGSSLEIITSSSQRYGRRFVGTIRSDAHIRVIDTATGETWTTFNGPANSRRIDIYDYVNNFQDLDNLLLRR